MSHIPTAANLPSVIQGGMGIGVSTWTLARAVSALGQLGVVSGTSLDVVVARHLQLGDPGGHLRRALERLPLPGVAERILAKFYIPGGKPAEAPFRHVSMLTTEPCKASQELSIATSFAAVSLAKEGHGGPVGFNLLEKAQLGTLFCLYGAMLAGVNVVLMGAGIPRQIPGVLDNFAAGECAELRIHVTGATDVTMHLDPREYGYPAEGELERPLFLPIVSSHVLAENLLKKSSGRVDGFVVEAATAGGHNAPPRGALQLSETGEPVYGERDAIITEKFRELGVPFWLAGGYGGAGGVKRAQALGAAGVQVGTAFGFCRESGFDPALRDMVLKAARKHELSIHTSAKASPTGFPFKVAQLPGTAAIEDVIAARPLVCDVGLLREAYQKEDGTIGYRCKSESVEAYLAKGGELEETKGRVCICNTLLAAVGLGQRRPHGFTEPPLITMGNDVECISELLEKHPDGYSAADVVESLLS